MRLAGQHATQKLREIKLISRLLRQPRRTNDASCARALLLTKKSRRMNSVLPDPTILYNSLFVFQREQFMIKKLMVILCQIYSDMNHSDYTVPHGHCGIMQTCVGIASSHTQIWLLQVPRIFARKDKNTFFQDNHFFLFGISFSRLKSILKLGM